MVALRCRDSNTFCFFCVFHLAFVELSEFPGTHERTINDFAWRKLRSALEHRVFPIVAMELNPDLTSILHNH